MLLGPRRRRSSSSSSSRTGGNGQQRYGTVQNIVRLERERRRDGRRRTGRKQHRSVAGRRRLLVAVAARSCRHRRRHGQHRLLPKSPNAVHQRDSASGALRHVLWRRPGTATCVGTSRSGAAQAANGIRVRRCRQDSGGGGWLTSALVWSRWYESSESHGSPSSHLAFSTYDGPTDVRSNA